MKKIRILDLAVQDLAYGRDFYEIQQEGIGDYFLDSLFADIDALLLYAGVHEQHFGYYRTLAKHFPFAIYYRLDGNEIQVWRVLDCRSSPRRTERALTSLSRFISGQKGSDTFFTTPGLADLRRSSDRMLVSIR